MEIIERILEKLEITPPASAVYIDLVEYGPSTARTIAVRLAMTRPSVYDQLKQLSVKGLVVERDIDGKTEFSIGDIADLERLMNKEKEDLEKLQKDFDRVSGSLMKKTESVEPKIKFITSREGILKSMHDMLWDESLTLHVVWPYQEMLRVLGREALTDFNEKRIRNGIRLKTVWSNGTKSKHSHIWEKGDWGVERRIAPAHFKARMGYTIYGNKVLFVSSARETFGFTVQSDDFAHLMCLQFDLLWDVSKPKKKK